MGMIRKLLRSFSTMSGNVCANFMDVGCQLPVYRTLAGASVGYGLILFKVVNIICKKRPIYIMTFYVSYRNVQYLKGALCHFWLKDHILRLRMIYDQMKLY